MDLGSDHLLKVDVVHRSDAGQFGGLLGDGVGAELTGGSHAVPPGGKLSGEV